MSAGRTLYASPETRGGASGQVTLLDLLDRLLAGGVVVHGHITLAAADIDLVDLDLAILLASHDKVAGT
ncbi:MAG TPA: gas vesicle protein GvpJ [Solirubrobacteraceae bacterium]|nr:gas vesicle protein GvpJ [Solirubrobacteraceae bacterium]